MKSFSIFTGFSSSLLGSLASCCAPSLRQPPSEKNVWPNEPDTPAVRVRLPGPEDSWQRMQYPGAAHITETAEAAHARPDGRLRSRSRSQSRSHSRSRRPRRRRLRPRDTASASSFFALLSSSSPPAARRLQISAPTNFRHLYSESFDFPSLPFQPLELMLVSPALADERPRTPPMSHERSYSSMSFHVPRRPLADSPLRTPLRTPLADDPGSARNQSMQSEQSKHPRPALAPLSANPLGMSPARAPSAPTVPPRSRLRSQSSPAMENMVERIASAMIEMEMLQADIDSVMERQSLYISSRPSTAPGLSALPSGEGLVFAPMPSLSALPAAAPSFAERLTHTSSTPSSITERPRTAPLLGLSSSSMAPAPLALPVRSEKSLQRLPSESMPSLSSASASSSPSTRRPAADTPLSPPLPLVLRPPLRKKKSFSQVSHWLLGDNPQKDSSHSRDISLDSVTNLSRPVTSRDISLDSVTNLPRPVTSHDISLDSVTNLPRPVTSRDGFYCVVPASGSEEDVNENRASVASVSTVVTLSTWTTGREQDERRRLEEEGDGSVTWSGSPTAEATGVAGPFMGHRPQSVGVAF